MQLCICHHYLLLTSVIITELDSVFDLSKKSRRKSVFDQCLSWHVFATHHSICLEFWQHLCMTFQSFQKLVRLLHNDLLINQEMASLCGGAIIPELCVYITLQYLAGGSYMDIFFLVGISQSSFFVYYGRQLSQLKIEQSYRLLDRPPRNGKSNQMSDPCLIQLVPAITNPFYICVDEGMLS